jgi:hypothetical protein
LGGFELFKKLTDAIQRIGERAGAKKKEELMKKHPKGLICNVVETNYVCTRGKYRNKPWNRIWTDLTLEPPEQAKNIYEVVQEYRGESGDFIVSLTTYPGITWRDTDDKELTFSDISGKKLHLMDYYVIYHRGLWVLANIESLAQNRRKIGKFSSVEVYPMNQKFKVEG